MTTIILAAVIAVGLAIGATTSRAATYHAPAHNFYQNNWMAGSD